MIVYTIVVTYNGLKWIDRCLGSLLNSNIPTSIIVVDNCSTDDTPGHIAETYKEVTLIRNSKNSGFGDGNNIGLKIAIEHNADYVFLLNQDAWVENNTIETLTSVAEKNPEFGIVSPIHLDGTGENIQYNFANYTNIENCPGLVSDIYLQKVKPVYEIGFVNAAAWLISKKCLLTVGGFDSKVFPHYGEDEDYVNRTKYHLFKTGVCPLVRVCHDNDGLTWDKIKDNYRLLSVHRIVSLKDINTNFRSKFLLFAKETADDLTSQLLFRKFKRAKVSLIICWMVLKKLKAIYTTRKIVRKKGAFLND